MALTDRRWSERRATGGCGHEPGGSAGPSGSISTRGGGGSDGNFTSPHTPTVDGLGAVGDGAHASHEYIRVDETLDRCALLALLLQEPAPADEKPP